MKRLITLLLTAITTTVLTGCANTELVSDIDPQVDISQIRSVHVVKFEKDNRGIEKLIANSLNGRGIQATASPTKQSQQPVQAIVEYRDKWMWDLTMYMLELNIDFRNPETNYKFATGRSYRTSLARKSPEEMVDRTN